MEATVARREFSVNYFPCASFVTDGATETASTRRGRCLTAGPLARALELANLLPAVAYEGKENQY